MSRVQIRACPRCGSRTRVAEGEDERLNLLCLACGGRELLYDGRHERYLIDKAAIVPGERHRPGPRPGTARVGRRAG